MCPPSFVFHHALYFSFFFCPHIIASLSLSMRFFITLPVSFARINPYITFAVSDWRLDQSSRGKVQAPHQPNPALVRSSAHTPTPIKFKLQVRRRQAIFACSFLLGWPTLMPSEGRLSAKGHRSSRREFCTSKHLPALLRCADTWANPQSHGISTLATEVQSLQRSVK